jgi:hypothetical protein
LSLDRWLANEQYQSQELRGVAEWHQDLPKKFQLDDVNDQGD